MTPEQKATLMSIATGQTAASAAAADEAADKPPMGAGADGPMVVNFPAPPSSPGGGGGGGGFVPTPFGNGGPPPLPTGDPWTAQPTFAPGDMSLPFPDLFGGGGGGGGMLNSIVETLVGQPSLILPLLGMLRRFLPNMPGLGDDRDNLFDTGQCSYMYDTLPKPAQDALAAWWCGMAAPIGLSADAQKYFLAIAVSRNPPPREDCCRR